MIGLFDPDDLIAPIGVHDRHVRRDGQGAVLWVLGAHIEGVALGFQGIKRVDHPPALYGPDPDEMELPSMTVTDGPETFDIPPLRGHVNSAGGEVFKLSGTYFVRVPDRANVIGCSVGFLDFGLKIEFTVDSLG